MFRHAKQYILPVSIFSLILGMSITPKANAAITAGADIYCFMRQSGNDHPSSWQAAYQYIKKQKAGFFKTSPKQAAGMIVELVVQDPEKYGACNSYLGDLFTGETTIINNEDQQLNVTPLDSDEDTSKTPKGKYIDPYNY
tara:strand:+ start:262 stop:681 length:420 start_codon:yes stop_codon:yes gene_type:complete